MIQGTLYNKVVRFALTRLMLLKAIRCRTHWTKSITFRWYTSVLTVTTSPSLCDRFKCGSKYSNSAWTYFLSAPKASESTSFRPNLLGSKTPWLPGGDGIDFSSILLIIFAIIFLSLANWAKVFFCSACYLLRRSAIVFCIAVSMRYGGVMLGMAKVDCKIRDSKLVSSSAKPELPQSIQLGL